MRYAQSLLGPGETVVFETRRHWLVYGYAILFLALFVGSLALPPEHQPLKFLAAIVLLPLAAVAAAIGWLRRAATDIAVTEKRLICKTGLIARHTVEMNLDKVESVDVDQSVSGRMFGYGAVTIRGVGTMIDPIRFIADPTGLRQAVFAGR